MQDPLADPERFAVLAATVADPVRRYLWRRADAGTADDVLALTITVLRERRIAPPDPVAQALAIARALLRNALRGQRRQSLLSQRLALVEPPQLQTDEESRRLHDRVRLALSRVAESDAEPLRLWAWDGLDAHAIGIVLGMPEEDATDRLERGRRRIGQELLRGSPERDGDLRALLRAIDPAASLPPLSDRELAVVLAGTDRDDAPPRRRSPWLIAGVGALAVAAIASLLLPLAFALATSSARLSGATNGCPADPAAALASAQVAFRAEVRSIDDGTVELRVLERFAGEVGDSVTVTQGRGVTWQTGTDYLLAADENALLGCGLTGPSSPELTGLYEDVFGAGTGGA
ncbi:hypothetical protein C1I63_01545 [Rathayibacter caricis DSM 15933]|uniref:Sigma-70 family RNA polymerase sigma factor n=1 Tax=Rathayibacter caricis DSM 15933 TaxID=1328867 RepID=A0A2T4UQ47_9MICO|nr:sigma-70 family RNA polymerase sigma factor [Rathayibacter caricis]PTL71658.1 hypothetical protein C1I63_01545 [Rathayibacter caricis DSM 15933]